MSISLQFFLSKKQLSPFGVVFRVLLTLGNDKTLMCNQVPFLILGADAQGWRNTITFNFSVLSYIKLYGIKVYSIMVLLFVYKMQNHLSLL